MLCDSKKMRSAVALLAEGVDRNPVMDNCYMDIYVALLAEGVDRNRAYAMIWQEWFRSPSSRRAWIEIGATQKERWTAGSRPPRGGRG